MKYEVQHSLLSSPTRTFKQDEVVTEADLKEHGFDVAFLLRNDAVKALKGSEGLGEAPPAAPAPLPPTTFAPPAPPPAAGGKAADGAHPPAPAAKGDAKPDAKPKGDADGDKGKSHAHK